MIIDKFVWGANPYAKTSLIVERCKKKDVYQMDA